MKTFGELLKDLRESRDLQQKDVAKSLNISNKQLSSYERNISQPPLNTLTSICRFYNVSADYLLQIERTPIAIEEIELNDKTETNNMVALTPEQKRVLAYYDRLNPEDREGIRGTMIMMYKAEKSKLK